jgi:Ca2+/H+ antiporter
VEWFLNLNDIPKLLVVSAVISAGLLLIGLFNSLVAKADGFWQGNKAKSKLTKHAGKEPNDISVIGLWLGGTFFIFIILLVIYLADDRYY